MNRIHFRTINQLFNNLMASTSTVKNLMASTTSWKTFIVRKRKRKKILLEKEEQKFTNFTLVCITLMVFYLYNTNMHEYKHFEHFKNEQSINFGKKIVKKSFFMKIHGISYFASRKRQCVSEFSTDFNYFSFLIRTIFRIN